MLYIFVFIKFILSGIALWAHSTPLLVIIFRFDPDSSPAGKQDAGFRGITGLTEAMYYPRGDGLHMRIPMISVT